MLVLLESVDGGGKSTYADSLEKTFKFLTEDETNPPTFVKVHKGQPTPGLDAFQEYELPLEAPDLAASIRSTRNLVVMDRWHAGELIYGPLYRGQSRLTGGGLLHVEMLLTALGALKLLAQPGDPRVVRQRLEDRGEDFLRLEHVNQVHGWYENHALTYHYTRASTLSPSQALEVAGHLAPGDPGKRLVDLPGYVGDPCPRVVLVGDQRNDGTRARLEFPRAFTPWDQAGSALYLMNALVLAGMRHEVGLFNANETGVDLAVLRDSPLKLNVVALGNHASKALREAGVAHEKVPHPQWWKRFRHGKIATYADAIKEAARWS